MRFNGVVRCLITIVMLGVAHDLFAESSVDRGSPVGLWQTIDDRTHEARGTVRIFEMNGKIFGRIEKSTGSDDDRAVCTACTDERKGHAIDGLVIIRNMVRDPDDMAAWSGGDVLDPGDGKIYRFRMRVEGDGARLVVRGYLGVSLLGRSQTWLRVQ